MACQAPRYTQLPMADVPCYKCGQCGHWSANCTLPPSQWIRRHRQTAAAAPADERIEQQSRMPALESRAGQSVHSHFPDSDDDDESEGHDSSDADADEADDDEENSGSGAAAPPRAYTTSINKRCGGFVDKVVKKGRQFVERYSKRNWAEQTDAHARKRARQSGESGNSEDENTEGDGANGSTRTGSGAAATAVPVADGAGVEDPQEIAAEGAPGAIATVAKKAAQRKKAPLVEAQCLMAFVRPSGRVDCIASAGVSDHPLTSDMKHCLEAALQLMVREQQLRASVDERVERKAKQLAASGSTHALEDKHVAPSAKLRTAARLAFQKHVAPVLGGLDVCTPDNWRQCIVKNDRGVCEAGGKCMAARAALGWPDDLALVDPNKFDPDSGWKRRFLQFLEDNGHRVQIPTIAPPKRQAVGVPPLRGREPRRATAATGTRTSGDTALMDLDLDSQGPTSQRPLNRSALGRSRLRKESQAAPQPTETVAHGDSSNLAGQGPVLEVTDLMRKGLEKLFGSDLVGRKSQVLAEHYLQEGVLLSEQLAAARGLIPSVGELKDTARLFTEADFEYSSIGELRRPEHLPLLDMLVTQTSLITEGGMVSLKSVRDSSLSDDDERLREPAGDEPMNLPGTGGRGHQPTVEDGVRTSASERSRSEVGAGNATVPQATLSMPRTSEPEGTTQVNVPRIARSRKPSRRAAEAATSMAPVASRWALQGNDTRRPSNSANVPGGYAPVEALRLRAVDPTYPIAPAIQGMLPTQSDLMQRVLSDSSAANAIMELGDADLAQRSMAGAQTAAKELFLKVYSGGQEKLAVHLSGNEAAMWLKLRKVPLQKNTSPHTMSQKIVHKLVKPDTERLENAKRRLDNIVLQHKNRIA